MSVNAAANFRQQHQEKQFEGKQKHVLFFSLEMSSEQLVNRILAIGTGIDSSRLRTGNINKFELEKLMHGQEKRMIEELPIIIDDSPSLSISGLQSRVVRLMRQYNIGIVIVDYLQLIRAGGNKSGGNRVHEIGEISQGLKSLAREMHIPVIALSQLSRAVESRDDKKPQLSDLRDSGNIEQDADVVMFLYREEYYLERKKIPDNEAKHNEWQDKLNKVKNIAEVIIAKQRNGPIGSLALHFNSATTAFTNLTYTFDGFDD
jgi:replicative DNA helicase